MAKKRSKKNVFTWIKEYFSDVKKESSKVLWTSKKNLVKYSIATLVFMIFVCVYFVASDVIIALLKGLIG